MDLLVRGKKNLHSFPQIISPSLLVNNGLPYKKKKKRTNNFSGWVLVGYFMMFGISSSKQHIMYILEMCILTNLPGKSFQ